MRRVRQKILTHDSFIPIRKGPPAVGRGSLSLSKEGGEPFVNGAEGCVRETRKGVLRDDDPHFSELFEALKNVRGEKSFRHAARPPGHRPGGLAAIAVFSWVLFTSSVPARQPEGRPRSPEWWPSWHRSARRSGWDRCAPSTHSRSSSPEWPTPHRA